MVTFPIHLDDADESNGCLKVIPNSHSVGVLTKNDQDCFVKKAEEHICTAK